METDTPTKITLAEARTQIDALTAHYANGWEWECQPCESLANWDERDAVCPHSREGDAPVSRLDVLAILDRVGA